VCVRVCVCVRVFLPMYGMVFLSMCESMLCFNVFVYACVLVHVCVCACKHVCL